MFCVDAFVARFDFDDDGRASFIDSYDVCFCVEVPVFADEWDLRFEEAYFLFFECLEYFFLCTGVSAFLRSRRR